jgi:hypothetical protein
MAVGISLAVLGAILAFAVRQGDSPRVDLHVVGLILMVAGGAVILYARHGSTRERVTTTIDDSSDPDRPTHTVIESFNDRDSGTDLGDRKA